MNKNSKHRQLALHKQIAAIRKSARWHKQQRSAGSFTVSSSPRKNVAEVVHINILPNGKRDSVTRFQPIDSTRAVFKRSFSRHVRA